MTRPMKGNKISTLLINLMIVLSLFIVSCTPVTSTPTPAPTMDVTDTPSATFTPQPTAEINIPAAEIDALLNKLVEQTPLAGIALGVQYKGRLLRAGLRACRCGA